MINDNLRAAAGRSTSHDTRSRQRLLHFHFHSQLQLQLAMQCDGMQYVGGEGGHKSNAPRSIYANSETGHPKALELPRATALNINALYTTLH